MSADSAGVEFLQKLARMSGHELYTRLRQEASKRSDLLLSRLGVDFASRSHSRAAAPAPFFFEPAELPDIVTVLQQRLPAEVDRIVARAERVCRHRFDLLGYEDLDYGRTIDWHLDAVHGKRAPRKPWYKLRYLDFQEVGDAKIIWELNRHQHLVTLAKAYCFTAEQRFADELVSQWYHWQQENSYPLGINWASSLEVAFRSLSWLWLENLLAGCSSLPTNFRDDLRAALALHGRHIHRYLSTYFSPNTHLLGEVVALFFIGALHPELPSAAQWQRCGWDSVLQQAARQVRPDGMHFEQSTYYHVYALDFFLHSRVLAARHGVPIPSSFDLRLTRMLEFLLCLSQAGIPPSFGDDDGGRVFDSQRHRRQHLRDPLATGAVLFDRADFKSRASGLCEETIWLLGAQAADRFDRLGPPPGGCRSTAFPDSGVYVMASSDPVPCQLVLNAGWAGYPSAGHAHADSLSFSLAADGVELMLDPGTFAYVGAEGERDRWRTTAAHSTMQVDGLSQAQPAGPFRWSSSPAGKVELWLTGEHFDFFAGSHDGYSRLPEPVRHRRWVFYLRPDFWLVRDQAEGQGSHWFDIHWRLGSPPVPVGSGHLLVAAAGGERCLALLPAAGSAWSQELLRDWWSPVYGRKEEIPVLRFRRQASVPVEFAMLLFPAAPGVRDLGRFELLAEGSAATPLSAYRFQYPAACHYFFFSDGRPWSWGPWLSDARFLYFGKGEDGDAGKLVLCEGSYFKAGAQQLVALPRMVPYLEYPGSALGGRTGEAGSGVSPSLPGWLTEVGSQPISTPR